MKKIIIAVIASLSIGATSVVFAEGSGDGALLTQERSAKMTKDAMAAKAAKDAEKAKADQKAIEVASDKKAE